MIDDGTLTDVDLRREIAVFAHLAKHVLAGPSPAVGAAARNRPIISAAATEADALLATDPFDRARAIAFISRLATALAPAP